MGIFGRSDQSDEGTAPHQRHGGEFLEHMPDYRAAQGLDQQFEEAPSPVDRAAEAFARGDRFLQVELTYASVSAEAGRWFYPVSAGDVTLEAMSAQVLAVIEDSGWRLEHANWVFMETGQSSRNKFLTTGQHTVTNGEVVGMYLFRREDTNRLS
ncbi:MAG: hypothetical protein ACSLE6_12515 [Mycobacterium sp.]